MSARIATLAIAVCLLVASSGCIGSERTGSDRPSPGPADDGLKVDDCVAPVSAEATSYREVWCTETVADLAKVSKVQSKGPGVAGALAQPECPTGTDIALSTTNFLPSQLGGQPNFGYACARNVNPPHPGDPGEGGGPDIVVGDCVGTDESDKVSETRCDGTADLKPAYRVTKITAALLQDCDPAQTDVTFTIGGNTLGNPMAKMIACAKKL